MNLLQRALIEKAGNDNGFEHVLESDGDTVLLASARHQSRAAVVLEPRGGYQVHFHTPCRAVLSQLPPNFSTASSKIDSFEMTTEADLATALRYVADASHAYTFHPTTNAYLQSTPEITGGLCSETEVERLVRQRIGQNKFRDALIAYWEGACAVTGVAIPEVLRASHAKPWAQCDSDAERLDVFNGFLLSANLDALFDRFLISFDSCGVLLVSPRFTPQDLHALGLFAGMKLRWIESSHQPYLEFHRTQFQRVFDS